MQAYGKTTWMIPDGYLGSVSHGAQVTHEAVCVLNTSDTAAEITLTLFFEDRPMMGGYRAVCGAQRTTHIRLDRIVNDRGESIPLDTPYAMVVESNVPVVVQYTRVDSSAAELALMTTMAYPVEGDT